MLGRMTLRSAIVAFAAMAAVAAHAMADTPKPVSVPAGELVDALETLARQCGVDVIYPSGQLKGFKTHGVSGTLETHAAFRKLLEGTPLVLKEEGGAVLISLPRNPTTMRPQAEESAPGQERFRFAQATQTVPADSTTTESSSASSAGSSRSIDPELADVRVTLPEVLVKGSKSLNTDIRRTENDAQPYVIFDHDTIERSGARDVEDFLRSRLPMNAQSYSNSQMTRTAGNGSQINLRGLGVGQTLILVDGHRRASGLTTNGGTPTQPDLNGIPLAAIERIEILPTTASGIYGGGATGGVINVVLRRDFSGVEARVAYDNTFDSDTSRRQYDVSAGFNLEDGKTNLLLAASYARANPLAVGDRDFLQQGIARILANNPDSVYSAAFPPLGYTTNIRSTAGNLTLKNGNVPLNSPFTYVPVGYTGTDSGLALVANAGHYNFDLAQTTQVTRGALRGLLNEPTVKSGSLTARREFTPQVQAFLDLSAADNLSLFDSNNLPGTYTIPSTSPANPFNQTVRVTTPVFGFAQPAQTKSEDRRAVGGVIVRLPRQWQTSFDYTWNRGRFSSNEFGATTGADVTAVNSGALNLFRDTNLFPVDFSSFVPQTVWTPRDTTLKDANLRFAGPIGSLPAGAPTLSALVERRDESLGSGYLYNRGALQSLFGAQAQLVKSAYMELEVPLFSAANAVRGIRDLQVQLAVRHDDYHSEASTTQASVPALQQFLATNTLQSTDPTFAVRYYPLRDVMLRASYGTGFMPPTFNQLAPSPPISTAASLLNWVDPRRGNQPLTGTIVSQGGGSPDLKPEQSQSWSAGIVLTPERVSGLRFSIDWSRIDKTDNIVTFLGNQALLLQELQLPAGLVIRAPAAPGDPYGVGPIAGLDLRARNLSRAQIEAYDVSVSYDLDTARAGRFELVVNGTRQVHFKTRVSDAMPYQENVGVSSEILANINPLELKGIASLTWSYRDWRMGWTTRYLDSYLVSLTPSVQLSQGNGGRVPSQTYHDVWASYGFTRNVLRDTKVQLGVRNVFNTKPPVDVANPAGYYSVFGDPRLSSYYLSLDHTF